MRLDGTFHAPNFTAETDNVVTKLQYADGTTQYYTNEENCGYVQVHLYGSGGSHESYIPGKKYSGKYTYY